ncbi:MAG TPA: hypothetical protein VFC43_03075 [Methanoregula sp.]|jgi:hypothetical protein|nr:hypothetical protein [Methanoregula sp.]
MNFASAFNILTVQDPGLHETSFEFYLNRLGINLIEIPRENVWAEIGGTLRLIFKNRGAPTHLTISSPNAEMFTDFFHENMYIVDETVLTIPIRKDCQEGFFILEIITGYGGIKTSLRVDVIPGVVIQKSAVKQEPPLQPVAHGRPHLLMVMMGIALILYSAFLYTKNEFLNTAAFIILIVGALYTWYRQQ